MSCPFHDDHGKSAAINHRRLIFTCFAVGCVAEGTHTATQLRELLDSSDLRHDDHVSGPKTFPSVSLLVAKDDENTKETKTVSSKVPSLSTIRRYNVDAGDMGWTDVFLTCDPNWTTDSEEYYNVWHFWLSHSSDRIRSDDKEALLQEGMLAAFEYRGLPFKERKALAVRRMHTCRRQDNRKQPPSKTVYSDADDYERAREDVPVPAPTKLGVTDLKVRAAVARLPKRQREVVEMRYDRKFKLEDIAHVLNITSSAVRQRLDAAARNLRRNPEIRTTYRTILNRNQDEQQDDLAS